MHQARQGLRPTKAAAATQIFKSFGRPHGCAIPKVATTPVFLGQQVEVRVGGTVRPSCRPAHVLALDHEIVQLAPTSKEAEAARVQPGLD